MRLFSILALSAILPAVVSAQEQDERHVRLVERYRAYLAHVAEVESEFQGSVTSTAGIFSDLGKVDFVLGEAYAFPRRYLHQDDHNFIFTAVEGQTEAEFEDNLTAMTTYIRLAMASRMYNHRARGKNPLVGDREGIEEVVAIAKRVYDFRERQVQMINDGTQRPSRVLTRETLGELGDPAVFEKLRSAYLAGENQFTAQRNAVVLVLLAVEIGASFLLAVFYLRRARPLIVVGRPAAAEADS